MYKPNLSRRFLAGIIDYTIIFGFMWAYLIKFGTPTEEGYEVNGLPALPIALFWLLATVGIEQLMGATIGNGIAGLKPLHVDGRNKPDFFQSLKRHLLDMIDMFPFGIIGYLTIKNTEKHQRLGDLWAKTIVVRDDEQSKILTNNS